MIPSWLFDLLAARRRSIQDLEARLAAWDELLADAEDVTGGEIPLDTTTWIFPAPPGQAESADDGAATRAARQWARIQRERRDRRQR